jgi:sulfate adenylyltransferase subunit 1
MADHLKIVVAGDVDSGKSTLIGRYLYESGSLCQGAMEDISRTCADLGRDFEFAYLLDSFEEERKEELTLDTTQCFCKLNKNKSAIFIDVPGHRELLKNMLSGASYAGMAILVIDINKPAMGQTKRHAFILKFLGISKIIIAINKADSVNYNEGIFLKAQERISRVFISLGIEFIACIPVSAKNGDNLSLNSKNTPWYKKGSLNKILDKIEAKKPKSDFRFLVQDVYETGKVKLAAGPIISGKVKKGDKTFILPEKKESRVKTIKYFTKNIASAKAPLAVGITLKDNDNLKRGQVLSGGVLPSVTKTIAGRIICVRDIDPGEKLTFRCAAQRSKVKFGRISQVRDTAVLLPKKGPPEENDVAEVILKTSGEVIVEKYTGDNCLGRFVLTDSREKIAAIGIVL